MLPTTKKYPTISNRLDGFNSHVEPQGKWRGGEVGGREIGRGDPERDPVELNCDLWIVFYRAG